MSLLIKKHMQMAVQSLSRTRIRTFLTALGIAIGVASIVLISSLSGSIQGLISNQVKAIGSNLVVVRPSSAKSVVDGIVDELSSSAKYQKSSLGLEDVDLIQEIDGVEFVAPVMASEEALEVGETLYPAVVLVGTNDELDDILGLTMRSGTFFDGGKLESVVVGETIAMNIFGTYDAIGRTVRLDGEVLIVSGVLAKMDDPVNFNNVDFDQAVLIQADYFNDRSIPMQIQQINVRTDTSENVQRVMSETKDKLREARRGAENFLVESGEEVAHPGGSLFGIISAMLSVVAGVSLVVGGLGVMNIMLVSVAERTREIGIRKAVGASMTHIVLQFLFESLILSVIGGAMGLALGYIVAFLVSLLTPFPPFISLSIVGNAFLIALVVGVVFGLIPALSAARKDPIDSLKFYR